ncbi:MAG: AgmX/PglI C-terminal domain-containing protein [Myxococcales bacterium]|jgi:hypothetical protein|nr:AgmX/PglI C-terminal domain-containing protein [Myxococcales bacterium]
MRASTTPHLNGFYLVLDKASVGPLSEVQIREYHAAGKLVPETYVWRNGMVAWLPAKEVDAFQTLFGGGPPPIPERQDEVDDDWFAGKASSSKATAGRAPLATESADDPFAVLSAEAEAETAAEGDRDRNDSAFVVGEQTRFFMIQAGMTQKQRNPPWKIALFIALFVGLPAGALFAMSKITVERTFYNEETGQTETAEVTVLSEVSEGFSDLRSRLLGTDNTPKPKEERAKSSKRPRRRKPKQEAPPSLGIPDDVILPSSPDEALGQRMSFGPEVSKSEIDFKSAQSDKARAQALYKSEDRLLTGPIGRKANTAGSPGLDGTPALAPEVMSGVIARNQKAFQACTENELRRNPRFKGGKIKLTLTIGSSGMVTKSTIDRADIAEAEIGVCLRQSARRIVFPSFEGEPFDLEIPLVLTAGF